MKISVDDVEIEATENFDVIATYTFAKQPGQTRPFKEVAVGYLFKTQGATILFLGDTLYHNAYVTLGNRYDIDLAIFNIGNNAPGGKDKPTPYDAYMIMESLRAKRFIPFHWETWGNVASDPGEVDWVFAKRNPKLHQACALPLGGAVDLVLPVLHGHHLTTVHFGTRCAEGVFRDTLVHGLAEA